MFLLDGGKKRCCSSLMHFQEFLRNGMVPSGCTPHALFTSPITTGTLGFFRNLTSRKEAKK